MIDVVAELESNTDLKYREFNANVVKSSQKIYGVRMPVLRDISKRICKDDWRSFLDGTPGSFEEAMIKGLVIANAKMGTDERLEHTRRFVPEIENWAVCDIMCGDWKVKAPEDREKLWRYCMELIETDDEFKMRVSAVMMLAHFLDDHHIDDVLSVMTAYDHDGYYYKMGAAWTLSYCFIKYPEKTEPFLLSAALDKEIRNKAVQKISDSYRVQDAEKERLKRRKKELFS